MAMDPHDGRSGALLVLGLGLLDWLLDDEDDAKQDQVAFGGSANAEYRPDETSRRDAGELIEDTHPSGVRFNDDSEGSDDGSSNPSSDGNGTVEDSSAAVEHTGTVGETEAVPTDGGEAPDQPAAVPDATPTAESDRSSTGEVADQSAAKAETDRSDPDADPEELDERIDEIEAKVGRLSDTVESLDTEFDSLQSALENIETDIELLVTQAQASLADTAEDGTVDASPTSAAEDETVVDGTNEEPSKNGDGAAVSPVDRATDGRSSGEQRVADGRSDDRGSRQQEGNGSVQHYEGQSSPAQDPSVDGDVSIGTSAADGRLGDDRNTTRSGRRSGRSGDDGLSSAGPDEPLGSESSSTDGGTDLGSDGSVATAPSTVSEVASQVNEQMDRVVGNGAETDSRSEPTTPVVGENREPNDPSPVGSDLEPDHDESSVDDIEQLLESDDWAVDIEETNIGDEEIDDILVDDVEAGSDETTIDSPAGEKSETTIDSPPEETDEFAAEPSSDEAIDPASLAESAAPADAVRTYVEEGDPEAESVTPEGGDDAFQFGKVLMPDDQKDDELPEIVGEEVEKPYIEELPSGYATDSLAIEWLGWLVDEGDPASAVDLLISYEEAGWLGEAVTDDLLVYLEGLVDAQGQRAGGDPSVYDTDTHLHSLEYVKEIANDPSLTEVTDDGI